MTSIGVPDSRSLPSETYVHDIVTSYVQSRNIPFSIINQVVAPQTHKKQRCICSTSYHACFGTRSMQV